MKGKPHILFLPRWYPRANDLMQGLFIKNHAECLAAHCNISVLYITTIAGQEAPMVIDEKTDKGVYSVTALISSSMGIAFRAFFLAYWWIVAFFRCYKMIRKKNGKPHLAHVHVLTRPGLMALWLKMVDGIPYLVSEHWSRYFPQNFQYKGWVRKVMTKIILRHSDALICVSVDLCRSMQKNGLRHAVNHIVPNVVDVALFRPAIPMPDYHKNHFIHISCFEEKSKNISSLLKAMKMVASARNDVLLHLVGEGPEKTMLENLAGQLGLDSDVVVFRGMLAPNVVVSELQQAHFLIQTSHYETFGTVVAESLACAVPVVSTRVGIFPEIYTPAIGIEIASPSADDIARSILQAIVLKDTFNRHTMRSLAVTKFGSENVAHQLLQIYQTHLKTLHVV